MNKRLFCIRSFEVKVRDILIVIGILLLLFFLVRCSDEKKEDKKEEKIKEVVKDVCGFSKQNINDLNELLSRSDLCSSDWYNDFDDFIVRLEEQQTALKKETSKEAKEIVSKQEKLLSKMKQFRKVQNEKTLQELEEAMDDYTDHVKKGCK